MKKLKKLELAKKVVAELDKKEARVLKGGEVRTHAWDTQVNGCFTYNCCK